MPLTASPADAWTQGPLRRSLRAMTAFSLSPATPHDIKLLWVADAYLRRAARTLGIDPPGSTLDHDDIERDPAHARRSLVARLDALEGEGETWQPRGGFWRDLMRACEALGVAERHERCRVQYTEALRRVGETSVPLEGTASVIERALER